MESWRVKLCSRGVRLRIYRTRSKRRQPVHQSDPPREAACLVLSCTARAMHAFYLNSRLIFFCPLQLRGRRPTRQSRSASGVSSTPSTAPMLRSPVRPLQSTALCMMQGTMTAPAPAVRVVRAAVSADHAAATLRSSAWMREIWSRSRWAPGSTVRLRLQLSSSGGLKAVSDEMGCQSFLL